MERLISRLGLIAFLSAATAMPAVAVDLKSAYLAALSYDAELLAAKAALKESEEGVPVARAALLPQMGYSTQKNKAETTTSFLNRPLPDVDSGRYDSASSVLSFRQALFRKSAWDALQGAKALAGAAEEDFAKDIQDAGLRVVSSYLEVLSAREAVTLAQNQTRAMDAWLTLAEKSFKTGRGTRTDIEDAKSRRDLSKAKETEANILLFTAARNFELVSGVSDEKIPDTNPRLLKAELMLVKNKDQWLQRIEDSSPEIQSLRKQLEAAQAGVAQVQGGHFPTVDLVAARQYGKSETNTTVGTAYTTDYVGVLVNIPILSGGGVMAQTRQALAREERVRQVLESTRRKTSLKRTDSI
ncbi:MAG: TolC family protein [Sulfuritalea sp.]|nr:TolC family protein [Sulfuritalea sp.]